MVRELFRAGKSGDGVRGAQAPVREATADTPARPMVEIRGARKAFGRRLVLDGVGLSASPGDLVVVTGDTGAGKTTLLRLIHGEVRPDQGEVWVDGHPLHRRWLRGGQAVRSDTGFIFQDHRLLPRLTAFENVVYGAQVSRPDVPFRLIQAAAHEALDGLELSAAKRSFPEQLSTGERQRVAVARALAAQPRLVLADEPAASQDDRTAELVMQRLAAAAAAGALVVVATHQLGLRCSILVNLPRLGAAERPRGRLAAAVRKRTAARRRAPA